MNVASRMQSYAKDGQVVLSAELYDLVRDDHPDAAPARVEVRGREEAIDVVVLTP